MSGPGDAVLGLVDLARYPIDRPGSDGYAAVVADCREQLATRGAAIRRGFVAGRGAGHPPVAAVLDGRGQPENAYYRGERPAT